MHVSINGKCAFSRSRFRLFGCFFFNAACVGTVVWCERLKCRNAKEQQFGEKAQGPSRSGEDPNVEPMMFYCGG